MPHQCVRCGEIHSNDSNAILEGCTECGAKLFFYVQQGQLDQAKERQRELSDKDVERIEEDVNDIIGEERDDSKPVVLDFETVDILGPGKYEIDLVKLFENKPLIYRLEEGKYVIDVANSLD
jgi:predicted  nucleic acid-binding Zn-ribbon protein